MMNDVATLTMLKSDVVVRTIDFTIIVDGNVDDDGDGDDDDTSNVDWCCLLQVLLHSVAFIVT